MFFNLFQKKSKESEAKLHPISGETQTNFVVSSKKQEISVNDNLHDLTFDEILDKVEESKNRGKHNIMFYKSTISKHVASKLHEEGIRIKFYKTQTPKFEIIF